MSKYKNFQIWLLILHIHGRSLASSSSDNRSWVPYVLGGTDASLHQIFFLVSICRRYGPMEYGHICGGSLITQRAVISAAHCSYNRSPRDFKLVMGILKQSQRTEHTLRFSVNTIIAHADFNMHNYDNDIVIYFAKGRVPRDHFVHPIKLPEYEPKPSSTCEIFGWGVLTVDNNKSADTAQQAKVELFTRSHCVDAYLEVYKISNGMICAGNRQGGVDSCRGDSGGPLVHDDVLIGIVSYGLSCGLAKYPGVYTNVFYYRDWINETLINSSNSRTHYILFIVLITEISKFVT